MSASDKLREIETESGVCRSQISEGRAYTDRVRALLTDLGISVSDVPVLADDLVEYETALARAEAELDALTEMARKAASGAVAPVGNAGWWDRLAEIKGARALRQLARPAALN